MRLAAWHAAQDAWAQVADWKADPSNALWMGELDAAADAADLPRLERAQAALRLPADQRPPLRTEPTVPATAAERWARPAAPRGPRPESLVAPEGSRLRGAYARRAAGQ